MTRTIAVILCTIILAMSLASCGIEPRVLTKGSIPVLSSAKTPSQDVASMKQLEGYLPVAANDSYELYFDTKLTGLLVRDKSTGEEWSSIPPAWQEDTIAKGSQKNNLASNILLECYDEGMQAKLFSTYSHSVKKGTFSYVIEDGSVRIDYQIGEDIDISLVAYLTANGMEVMMPMQDIAENSDLKLSSVTILPFFGAIKSDSDGYLFIPDGSGAIIDVKKNDVRLPAYTSKVYGWDNGIFTQRDDSPTDSLTAPVFGAKSGDKAFLGIIKQMDYMSSISALCGNTGSEYYSISPVMTYRDFHSIVLFKDTSRERVVYDMSKKVPVTNFVVEYQLMTGETANYVGMAHKYQSYLLDNNLLQQNEEKGIYLDLTLLGAIRIKDTLAGVPAQRVHSFTSFAQAKQLLERLKQSGVDSVHLNYKGANSGGYMYGLNTKFQPDKGLGGEKGFKELREYADANDISLAVVMEALTTSKQDGNFKKSRDANRYYSNNFSMVNTVNPVTYAADTSYKSSFIVTPPKVPAIVNSFLESSDVNMTVDRIGKMLYSDFKKESLILRQESGEIWNEILADLRANNEYLPIYGANSYVYPYGSNLVGVPNSTSNHDVITRQVPFLQIVLHGYLPYSHTPLNLETNYTKSFLQAMEYGAMPSFELVASDCELLQRSKYQVLVSADMEAWFDRIVESYTEFEKLFVEIADLQITDHYMAADNVYCTEYGNKAKVYVNYNDKAVNIDGITIQAHSYGLIK